MSLPSVALIILNWNQRELTLDCLRSVREMAYPPDRLMSVVVDNASSDGSVEAVRADFPEAIVIVNPDNLGFAEGNNPGIQYALATGADYIMLMNNDTVVAPDMLTELVATAEADPRAGIVTPAILYMEPHDVVWCTGATVVWSRGTTKRLNADVPAGSLGREPFPVDIAVGCALCARREVFEVVGLLDPRYYMYHEEADFCYRTTAAGWRILCVPRARLWHKISASIGGSSPLRDYYLSRNILLFVGKNRQGRFAKLTAWAGALVTILRGLVQDVQIGRLRPNGYARLRGVRDALLGRWGNVGVGVSENARGKGGS